MRGRSLGIFAMISLAMLGLLLCGYFGHIRVSLSRLSVSPRQQLLRETDIALRHGGFIAQRLDFFYDNRESDEKTERLMGFAADFDMPQLGPSIWELKAGTVLPGPSPRAFVIAFPIWCLAIPCTIAPALWLRRCRRRRMRGFAMEPTSDAKADLQSVS